MIPRRGKLIAIEGIDGSGKHTQLDLLAAAFHQRGIAYARFSFPNYESLFGKLAARYLNGDFGSLETMDPHLSALLFAGDRFEAKEGLEAALAAGKTILADRYVGSNLAHQTARVVPSGREEFLAWLKHLEYGIYGLPREDVVLYMRLPVAEAQRLVGTKPARRYTLLERDLQEADPRHLEQAALVYDELSGAANWIRLECQGSAGLRPAQEIHQAALQALDARLPELACAASRPTSVSPHRNGGV
jgi:dTMP kinase